MNNFKTNLTTNIQSQIKIIQMLPINIQNNMAMNITTNIIKKTTIKDIIIKMNKFIMKTIMRIQLT